MPNLTNESQNKKKSLGRGLGSLLGAREDIAPPSPNPAAKPPAAQQAQVAPQESLPPDARIWKIPVEKLVPSPYQPRTQFPAEKIKELADSIKERGILQPIVARKLNNGTFEIIAGERRWRAAQAAGLFEVPVQIKVLSNREALEIAIIENVQREDLTPLDEAEAYQRLVREFNLTQQQVAERVGKERATVTNALRLLALPKEARELLASGAISQGHAKVLLSLGNAEDINSWAKKVAKTQLSVRALERDLKKQRSPVDPIADSSHIETYSRAKQAAESLRGELQKKLGTKVLLDYEDGEGKIVIHFYSDEELTALAEKLGSKN